MIIIGILAAIAIPVFLSQRAKAQDTAAKADVSTLGKEIATYFVDNTAAPAAANQALIASGQYRLNNVVIGRVSQSTITVKSQGYSATNPTQSWCVALQNTAGQHQMWKYSAARAGSRPALHRRTAPDPRLLHGAEGGRHGPPSVPLLPSRRQDAVTVRGCSLRCVPARVAGGQLPQRRDRAGAGGGVRRPAAAAAAPAAARPSPPRQHPRGLVAAPARPGALLRRPDPCAVPGDRAATAAAFALVAAWATHGLDAVPAR